MSLEIRTYPGKEKLPGLAAHQGGNIGLKNESFEGGLAVWVWGGGGNPKALKPPEALRFGAFEGESRGSESSWLSRQNLGSKDSRISSTLRRNPTSTDNLCRSFFVFCTSFPRRDQEAIVWLQAVWRHHPPSLRADQCTNQGTAQMHTALFCTTAHFAGRPLLVQESVAPSRILQQGVPWAGVRLSRP